MNGREVGWRAHPPLSTNQRQTSTCPLEGGKLSRAFCTSWHFTAADQEPPPPLPTSLGLESVNILGPLEGGFSDPAAPALRTEQRSPSASKDPWGLGGVLGEAAQAFLVLGPLGAPGSALHF